MWQQADGTCLVGVATAAHNFQTTGLVHQVCALPVPYISGPLPYTGLARDFLAPGIFETITQEPSAGSDARFVTVCKGKLQPSRCDIRVAA